MKVCIATIVLAFVFLNCVGRRTEPSPSQDSDTISISTLDTINYLCKDTFPKQPLPKDTLFTLYLDSVLVLPDGSSSKIRFVDHIRYLSETNREYDTKTLSIYDESERLKTHFSTYQDTNIYLSYTRTDYLYDSKNSKKQKEINYLRKANPDGCIGAEMEYFYSGNQLESVIQTTFYKNKPSESKKRICKTDSLGNIIKDYEYCWQDCYYQYDSLNRIIKFDGYELGIEYIYKNGVKYQEITNYGGKEVTTFDSKGLEISMDYYDDSLEEAYLSTQLFTYTYDKKGNWIKKFVTQDNKTRLIEKRNIVYY